LNALSPDPNSRKRHIEAPTALALAYIARNLRANDHIECLAGRIATVDQLAAEATLTPGLCDIVYLGDYPVAAIGAREMWKGVWSVWAWGTENWNDVATTLTRHALRTLKPAMLARGGHRAECMSWTCHIPAHRWLEFLGFQREGVLHAYGRNREDFIMYAWRLT
jgi:hypothetical protein